MPARRKCACTRPRNNNKQPRSAFPGLHAPAALPSQHDAVDDDGQGHYDDEQRRSRENGGIDPAARIRKNDLRQRRDARTRKKLRNHQIIERQGEGQQPCCNNARGNAGQGDERKNLKRPAAQIHGGFFK